MIFKLNIFYCPICLLAGAFTERCFFCRAEMTEQDVSGYFLQKNVRDPEGLGLEPSAKAKRLPLQRLGKDLANRTIKK